MHTCAGNSLHNRQRRRNHGAQTSSRYPASLLPLLLWSEMLATHARVFPSAPHSSSLTLFGRSPIRPCILALSPVSHLGRSDPFLLSIRRRFSAALFPASFALLCLPCRPLRFALHYPDLHCTLLTIVIGCLHNLIKMLPIRGCSIGVWKVAI